MPHRKMIQVIALHDLTYVDHERTPQYRRQSSVPFPMDEDNVRDFLRRKAIKVVEEPVQQALPENSVEDEEEDFSEEEEEDFQTTENSDSEARVNKVSRNSGKRKPRR